ncbi:hypothetical protein LINPERHAP1_LOCUS20970 [Linum perenne]
MKLVWGIFTHPTELWMRVLSSKYLKSTSEGLILARKRRFLGDLEGHDESLGRRQ